MRSIHIYIYPIFLIASVILAPSNADAQNDEDIIRGLKEKFNNYTRSFPREEVYVHTDREEYIAGEEAFFTSYVINRQSLKASPFSRIVYVELLNSLNVPVLQKKFIVNSGSGPGSMKLPDTLATGIYRLIAYTSWMRNFIPDNCFSKEIAVYNLLKDEKAEIRKLSQSNRQIQMPGNTAAGVSLNVDRTGKDSIRLNIKPGNNSGINTFHVIIQTHGNIIFTGSYRVNHSNGILIPASALQPGINQVTLFSDEGKPLSERLLYSSSSAGRINVQCDDTSGIREDIKAKFSAPGMRVISGQFSLSVAPGTQGTIGISEYLLTGTEFGIIYSDISGGSEMDDISVKVADSILSGRNSNWINWKNIVHGNYPECRFPMETEYHYVMGRLHSEKELSDSSHFVLLCTPGRAAFFRYAVCDEEGRFSFPVGLGSEINDYIIIPQEVEGFTDITIQSPFITPDQHTLPFSGVTASIPKYIPKWSINYQVNKLYGIPDTIKSNELESDKRNGRFYGKPDIELVMDDYINLPLMEEVFFEILSNVSVRKRGTKREIIITDRVNNMPFQALPCLMIDGVIIRDAELILNLDPELVEKIDVIKEKYIVGKYVFPGIVNVITRRADFSAIDLPAYMKRFSYKVADTPSAFKLPDSQKVSPRIPDYRNTLYWNPSLTFNGKVSSEVSFRSSDNAADYTIFMQGITEDGTWVSEKKVIRVLF